MDKLLPRVSLYYNEIVLFNVWITWKDPVIPLLCLLSEFLPVYSENITPQNFYYSEI